MADPVAITGTYAVDTMHTIPMFEIRHLGLSHYVARFTKVSGTVTLDVEKKTGAAEIIIDAASVSTAIAEFDGHLKGKDYFDVEKYPTITFKAGKFKFEGDKVVEIAGDLSMHGVSKPVTFKVTGFVCIPHHFRKVPACGADASATIKRTDWGVIGPYPPPLVAEEVKLRILIEGYKT